MLVFVGLGHMSATRRNATRDAFVNTAWQEVTTTLRPRRDSRDGPLPPLLLTFILASILLSPVQGPLGIANSAMVLFSLIIVGLAIDHSALAGSVRKIPEMNVRASA